MNTKKHLFSIAFLFVLAPSAASACEAAGPSTHVGRILSTDIAEKTFTIFDAQTANPVTFRASENLMKKVVNVSGTAFVDFEVYGSDLIATDVSIK